VFQVAAVRAAFFHPDLVGAFADFVFADRRHRTLAPCRGCNPPNAATGAAVPAGLPEGGERLGLRLVLRPTAGSIVSRFGTVEVPLFLKPRSD
jgi:hypothetical protein